MSLHGWWSHPSPPPSPVRITLWSGCPSPDEILGCVLVFCAEIGLGFDAAKRTIATPTAALTIINLFDALLTALELISSSLTRRAIVLGALGCIPCSAMQKKFKIINNC